jgi:hypothetical protein
MNLTTISCSQSAIAGAERRARGRRRGAAAGLLPALAVAWLACSQTPTQVAATDDTIGPGGGTFTTVDGAVTIVVPAGALDQPVTITATRATAPSGLPVIAGTAWEFGPDGTQFAVPVEVTISYDPANVSGDPANLRLVQILASAGELELATDVGRDAAANTVTGTIRHFSGWGVATCGPNCLPPPDLTAEYEGVNEGVALSWTTPTWSRVTIYRAALRQCEPGETSGRYGPYECVSSPAEALTPPPDCLAPGTAPDGRPCVYTRWGIAAGGWGGLSDRGLGSRGAIFWYLARGGADENPLRAWSHPPQQVTHFGTPDAPDVPADFTATAISDSAIRLTWQPTPTASGYELERLDNGAWSGSTLPYSDYEFTEERLMPNTQYQYRIRSVNEYGVSAYAFANATTGAGGGAGCTDFNLRLDFNPVEVVAGGGDVVPVFVDRQGGFTGQVEVTLVSVPNGPNWPDVFETWEWSPSLVDAGSTYSILSFRMRTDVTPGAQYEFQVAGGSPLIETAPAVCLIPITFEVITP